MKVLPAQADSIVKSPPGNLMAALIYGPDAGHVTERVKDLTNAIVDDPTDPFCISNITVTALKNDNLRLADEAASMSLMGGRRVVQIQEATDDLAKIFSGLLETGQQTDAFFIVEASDLGPRSTLRKLFENAKNAAAIACYSDDSSTIKSLVRSVFDGTNITVSDDALSFLTDNLGGDRMVSRSELEKLKLYKGSEAGEVTLSDAISCVGDTANLTLEDLAFAAAGGDLKTVSRLLDRTRQEGIAIITILRAVGRHFQRLHLASGQIANGQSPEQAMKALKPPVFFKRLQSFRLQSRRWSITKLEAVIASITQAETSCKSTGSPDELICGQLLLRITVIGQRL